MALDILVDDGGAVKLRADYRGIEQQVLSRLKAANEKIAHDAVEMLTQYPPETQGNFPPPPYWERGEGMKNAAGETTEKSYKYGESKDRWRYETSVGNGEVVTRASTEVPYAPYVSDANLQAWFHAENGWLTDVDVVNEMEPIAQREADVVMQTIANINITM